MRRDRLHESAYRKLGPDIRRADYDKADLVADDTVIHKNRSKRIGAKLIHYFGNCCGVVIAHGAPDQPVEKSMKWCFGINLLVQRAFVRR